MGRVVGRGGEIQEGVVVGDGGRRGLSAVEDAGQTGRRYGHNEQETP